MYGKRYPKLKVRIDWTRFGRDFEARRLKRKKGVQEAATEMGTNRWTLHRITTYQSVHADAFIAACMWASLEPKSYAVYVVRDPWRTAA